MRFELATAYGMGIVLIKGALYAVALLSLVLSIRSAAASRGAA